MRNGEREEGVDDSSFIRLDLCDAPLTRFHWVPLSSMRALCSASTPGLCQRRLSRGMIPRPLTHARGIAKKGAREHGETAPDGC